MPLNTTPIRPRKTVRDGTSASTTAGRITRTVTLFRTTIGGSLMIGITSSIAVVADWNDNHMGGDGWMWLWGSLMMLVIVAVVGRVARRTRSTPAAVGDRERPCGPG